MHDDVPLLPFAYGACGSYEHGGLYEWPFFLHGRDDEPNGHFFFCSYERVVCDRDPFCARVVCGVRPVVCVNALLLNDDGPCTQRGPS